MSQSLDEKTKLAENFRIELEQLEKEQDGIRKELELQKQSNQELEADHLEWKERKCIFDEEMVKAEAQIELIKDVLFSEPGK